ncbi:hypothetical protein [Pseudomonas sp. P97.38]|uniref:hypothetical protein n=1 Tax=Pseudomonas sp. P97.38 TaxID=255451 RepID=UPI000A4BB4F5|nr:hypothetical protein [Pseudomonas sp. P97.38]
MLAVEISGVARAHSFTCLSELNKSLLADAVVASAEDREALKSVVQQLVGDRLSSDSVDEAGFRSRSNSTILPSKKIQELQAREQEKKINVFDQSPYKEQVTENKKIERFLGKNLSCNPELTLIARSIREVTGSPMSFSEFSLEQQQKIREESLYIGGAKELLADEDTLDAHVLATLIKAESKEYDIGNMERRKCMFNHVRSPDNPIYPWNSHRFDLEIFEVKNPIQYTEEMRNLIADRWGDFLVRQSDVENYLYQEVGISQVDLNDGILNILQSLSVSERKTLLKDVLHINWSTEVFVEDERNARDSNPLGAEYRQHTTGARSNVVRVSDDEDKNVNKWVFEAIVHGKPVTSGPSGHTLRYLNHFAMCSEMLTFTNPEMKEIPSLEEARLVMLANLMAPKDHHSYHEIMLASIGVYNGAEMLAYDHKDSYEDIRKTAIGAAALDNANAVLHET